MTISCFRGDLIKDYFVARHEEKLNEKLQSKLGKYAEITINTISNEDGGDIELSLGVYDLRDELVSFSQVVAERINNDKDYDYDDFTAEEVERTIKQFLNINNLNIDIDWKEDSKSITLFFNDKDYKSISFEGEMDKHKAIILDELYNAVNHFIDDTIKTAIKEFNEAWVYEYSAYEDEYLND